MRNVFRKRLSNTEKVLQSKEKIQRSFGLFNQINNDIEEAKDTLQSVIQEEKEKVTQLELNINSAQRELKANEELQKQIKPFIKE